jgi:hypothetical protein
MVDAQKPRLSRDLACGSVTGAIQKGDGSLGSHRNADDNGENSECEPVHGFTSRVWGNVTSRVVRQTVATRYDYGYGNSVEPPVLSILRPVEKPLASCHLTGAAIGSVMAATKVTVAATSGP